MTKTIQSIKDKAGKECYDFMKWFLNQKESKDALEIYEQYLLENDIV